LSLKLNCVTWNVTCAFAVAENVYPAFWPSNLIVVATAVPDVSGLVATSLAKVRVMLPTEPLFGATTAFQVPAMGVVKSQ